MAFVDAEQRCSLSVSNVAHRGGNSLCRTHMNKSDHEFNRNLWNSKIIIGQNINKTKQNHNFFSFETPEKSRS